MDGVKECGVMNPCHEVLKNLKFML